MKPISEITPETGGHYEEPMPATATKKPTRKFCQDQLSRLKTKKRAPYDEGDEFRMRTVIDALHSASEDSGHVVRIVDLLEQGDTFPDGYAIRQFAYDTRTREKRPDPQCQKCHGLGQEFYAIPGTQGAARKCDCWRDVVRQGAQP